MRIVKEPEERRDEILNTAERLFVAKGYSQTSITDILNEIGVAKGTFYYYYKSKEEVMDAIIMRTLTRRAERARIIASDSQMNAVDKLLSILLEQNSEEDEKREEGLTEQFHKPENAEMHQKSMIQVVYLLAPVLADVVRQGVDEGLFSTKYPLESVEVLLTASSTLFDEGMFNWTAEEKSRRARAFLYTMERVIGAGEGCFDNILPLLDKQVHSNEKGKQDGL